MNNTPGSPRLDTLPPEAVLEIGRIIRSTAEIEDIVSLAVGKYAKITESATMVMMGRSAIRTRLQILQALASAVDEHKSGPLDWLLGGNFTALTACRNAVAHGVFMGADPKGNFCFITARIVDSENGGSVQAVKGYDLEALRFMATAGETVLPMLEHGLGLEALRQRRREQPLEGPRKGPAQQPKGAKRKLRQRPSQA